MNPIQVYELSSLRAHELQKDAEAQRLARNTASKWDHSWRRGLGRLGERLRAAAASLKPQPSNFSVLELSRHTGARI